MLRIEKVFLQGFKSFNDPTELAFDLEGITAVVGPNGCGKSNVADALSWVIGEQRAKALRGGKMEDVIFQGSRNRKPSGMAEVILTLRVFETFEIQSTEKNDSTPTTSQFDEVEVSEANKIPQPEATETIDPVPNQTIKTKSPHKSVSRVFQEGERITVGRRLYRTGESEYEMNGRTCRLRDIQDLFAGTGLGGAHYAIIEQGRIGQVLSAKPLDRRALIEEAAGISKFKMRQRASELKLEAARQNLSRLTDIIAEVERQQNSLKRQAAKSRRYQRLRNEMRDLMRAVFVADFRATEQSLKELESARQSFNQDEADLANQISDAETKRSNLLEHVGVIETKLTQSREDTAQTNLLLEKAKQQQQYLNEQVNALRLRSMQFSHDQGAISERERLTTAEIDRLREELKAIEEQVNIEASSLNQSETIFLQQSAADNQQEKELEAIQKRLTDVATQRERWKQLVNQFSDSTDRSKRTLSGLTLEYQRASEQSTTYELEFGRITEHLASLEFDQAELLRQKTEIESSLTAKRQNNASLENSLQQIREKSTITELRLKSLLELDDRHAYYSEPVQAIIQASKEGSQLFNITSTLADFIKVNSQDEAIVEVGLREELQYLITPSFDQALKAIEFLKQENLGRATFLILGTTTNGHHNESENLGQIVRLIDLLGLKPELRSVLQKALPRLSQTVIAQEIQQAIKDSVHTNGKGNTFLTTSGELVSAGHVISGGSSIQEGKGILALKREIESLRNEASLLHSQLVESESESEELKSQLQALFDQSNRIDNQLREIEKTIVIQQGLKSQTQREKERALTHLQIVNKEIEQAREELNESTEKLRHAESELQIAEEAFITVERHASETQEIVLSLRRAAADRTQELSRRRADFAAKSERRKGFLQDIKRLENEAQDIQNRLTRYQMEAIENESQIQNLTESIDKITEEIERRQLQFQDQLVVVEVLQTETNQYKEALQSAENELNRLRDTINVAREKRTETEISQARLQANLEHIESACQDDLGEAISDLLIIFTDATSDATSETPRLDKTEVNLESNEEIDEEENEGDSPINFQTLEGNFDLELAKIRLQDLRRKVDAIGPVNLLALDELSELEQRLLFLLEQRADIEKAVTDTMAVITELKKRSRERFVHAFHEINKNFSEMFLELFGGGHGEMRLIDENDVLESGIDIIAQPPGKRLQNVLLLSGGEKAMAALALIMGIFKYRPSPFCLLDEVDAPLDDVNIGRFADKVLEMSNRTQFLVITHSKRTMEAAKSMYGVTMEDPGVSKLISVRLS